MNRRTFILMLAAGLFAGCGKRKKLPALPPGSGVLAFGDSVTWGTIFPLIFHIKYLEMFNFFGFM